MNSNFDRRYASSFLDEMDLSGKNVLDVGFGDGWLIDAKWRQVHAMTAVENNPERAAKAEARWAGTPVAEKVVFLHANIADMFLPANLYDAAIFVHSF